MWVPGIVDSSTDNWKSQKSPFSIQLNTKTKKVILIFRPTDSQRPSNSISSHTNHGDGDGASRQSTRPQTKDDQVSINSYDQKTKGKPRSLR